jgi:hypothetical protein
LECIIFLHHVSSPRVVLIYVLAAKFNDRRHIFTLDNIPSEAIRLVRQEEPDQLVRYRDDVVSTYIWNGLVMVLPRRPRYVLPYVR